MGTCTSTMPASSTDYHVVHRDLDLMATMAEVQLGVDLAPHRPVKSTLRLCHGSPVPDQCVLPLPVEAVVGPQRAPTEYNEGIGRVSTNSKST